MVMNSLESKVLTTPTDHPYGYTRSYHMRACCRAYIYPNKTVQLVLALTARERSIYIYVLNSVTLQLHRRSSWSDHCFPASSASPQQTDSLRS